MEYQPREGVDYIVDLYQIAAVPQDAESDVVKQALHARALEYHPDRLQGLAPEFREKGEHMARLLNRAKVVLLDDEKRSEYDEILAGWEGPISADGTPVIRLDDSIRAEMALKSPEEIEASFTAYRERVADMVKHNPKHQAMLGRMLETAEGEEAEEIREAYDAALFAEDQVLAIEEAERGKLVGLATDGRYESSLDYTGKTKQATEAARTEQKAEHMRRSLGGVSARLALLAGDSNASTDVGTTQMSGELPHYFDDQAERIVELAAKREELLAKRLEIFQPTYPIAELQVEAHPDFIVGVTGGKDGTYAWLGFNFDKEHATLASVDLPEDIQQLLAKGEFGQVYNSGFNILIFATKEQIEVGTLLEEAYNKHLQKFFPGSLG